MPPPKRATNVDICLLIVFSFQDMLYLMKEYFHFNTQINDGTQSTADFSISTVLPLWLPPNPGPSAQPSVQPTSGPPAGSDTPRPSISGLSVPPTARPAHSPSHLLPLAGPIHSTSAGPIQSTPSTGPSNSTNGIHAPAGLPQLNPFPISTTPFQSSSQPSQTVAQTTPPVNNNSLPSTSTHSMITRTRDQTRKPRLFPDHVALITTSTRTFFLHSSPKLPSMARCYGS